MAQLPDLDKYPNLISPLPKFPLKSLEEYQRYVRRNELPDIVYDPMIGTTRPRMYGEWYQDGPPMGFIDREYVPIRNPDPNAPEVVDEKRVEDASIRRRHEVNDTSISDPSIHIPSDAHLHMHVSPADTDVSFHTVNTISPLNLNLNASRDTLPPGLDLSINRGRPLNITDLNAPIQRSQHSHKSRSSIIGQQVEEKQEPIMSSNIGNVSAQPQSGVISGTNATLSSARDIPSKRSSISASVPVDDKIRDYIARSPSYNPAMENDYIQILAKKKYAELSAKKSAVKPGIGDISFKSGARGSVIQSPASGIGALNFSPAPSPSISPPPGFGPKVAPLSARNMMKFNAPPPGLPAPKKHEYTVSEVAQAGSPFISPLKPTGISGGVGSPVVTGGGGDGGGGGSDASSTSYATESDMQRKQNPHVLGLPSLQRQQLRAPAGVDITVQSSPITQEEEDEFLVHVAHEVQEQNRFFQDETNILGATFDEMARNGMHPPDYDVVMTVIKPVDIHEFATNDATYAQILTEMANVFAAEDAPPAAMGMLNHYNNGQQRIRQLAELLFYMGGMQRLGDVTMMFSRNPEQYKSFKREFTQPEINSILLREKLYNNNPAKAAQSMIREFGRTLPPNETGIIKQVMQNTETDIALREHGHLSDTDFENRMWGYWAALMGVMERTQPPGGENVFLKHRSNAIISAQTDFQMLMNRMDMIDRIIRTNPNSAVSQQLGARVLDIINKLKDHRYDLREAYGQLNGIYNIMKPVILNPQEYSQSQLEVGDVFPETKEKMDIEPGPPMTNVLGEEVLAPHQGGEQFYRDRMQQARDTYGLFSYPNLQIKPRARQGFIVGMGLGASYVPDPARGGIANALDRVGQHYVLNMAQDGKNVTIDMLAGYTPTQIMGAFDLNELRNILNRTIAVIKHDAALNFSNKYNPRAVYMGKVSNDPGEYAAAIKDITQQIGAAKEFIRQPKPELTLTNRRQLQAMVRAIPIGKRVAETTRNVAQFLPIVPPSRLNPPKQPHILDVDLHPAERQRRAQMRETKFTQENFKFGKKLTKETPEINRAEYGKNIIEYDVKTDADLMRMKSEITRMKGKLYIIDLQTGRLFPIRVDKTFVGQNYVFKIDSETVPKVKKVKEKKLGDLERTTPSQHHPSSAYYAPSHAYYPTLHHIMRQSEDLLPYEFMRNGNDKAPQMLHMLHRTPYFNDYRDQVRKEMGAGFWKAARKVIGQAGKSAGNYVVKKTFDASRDFGRDTVHEAKNFYNQEKKNVNYIGNANKQLYKNPSFGNLNKAIHRTMFGGVRMLMQPAVTAARQTANVSDFIGKVPGLNIAKAGAEFFIPPLGVADALVHGVKNVDEGRYYDAAINAGDALLGSNKLNGAVDVGAKILTTGLKLGDRYADPESHKK